MRRRGFIGALLATASAPVVAVRSLKARRRGDKAKPLVFREGNTYIEADDCEEISPGVYKITARFEAFQHGHHVTGLHGSDFVLEKRKGRKS